RARWRIEWERGLPQPCKMESMPSPVVAVTIGDPAGIGPEIVVRALAQDAVQRSVQALVVGDRWVLERAMEVTGTTLEFSPAGPGALTGSPAPLTMFAVRNMRIFCLTRHMSLREAVAEVKRDRLAAILPRIGGELRTLGFDRPRIAVAALNPHAGEGGALGKEDLEEIAPAVQDARGQGWQVDGPVPADAVFAQALDGRYDAVLALYHDQGHIAAKTLDFHGAVSVTLALPFIRTSVDHGTAFDIAGKGLARAEGMAAAILRAGVLARRTNVGRRCGHAQR